MTAKSDNPVQDNNIEPNAERIKLWTDALESGKYTQGFGALYSNDDDYSALGVACDVYRWHSGDKRAGWDDEDDSFGAGGREEEYEIMPNQVAAWFGVSQNPEIEINGVRLSCTAHDDALKHSFLEIAAGIKRLVQDAG